MSLPEAAPQWEAYEPPAATGFGKLFLSGYDEKVARARSEFEAAARDFVARNPRLQLIEGQELLHLLKKHLGMDALLGIKRTPPRSG